MTEEQLEEITSHSGVLSAPAHYLEAYFRQLCQQFIAKPEETEPSECVDAYLYLKNAIKHSR